MNKRQERNLNIALEKLNAIINKARGLESRCGCSEESCKELELYISSWIIPPIESAINNEKEDYY